MAREELLTRRAHPRSQYTRDTIKIIEKHGNILLKRPDGWYLSSWTNIAAGPDNAVFGRRESALEMFSLQWAFAIATLYKCQVYAFYPENVVR